MIGTVLVHADFATRDSVKADVSKAACVQDEAPPASQLPASLACVWRVDQSHTAVGTLLAAICPCIMLSSASIQSTSIL